MRKRPAHETSAADSTTDRKESRTWKAVNSPLFLWMLSATLVTLGGAYINQSQRCVSEGSDVLEKHNRAVEELRSRTMQVFWAVTSATTMEEARTNISKVKHRFGAYKDSSQTEVLYDIRSARRRLSLDEMHYNHPPGVDSEVVAKFFSLVDGVISPQLTDADLPGAKNYARAVAFHRVRAGLEDPSSLYVARCSFGSVINMALTGRPFLEPIAPFPIGTPESASK